MTRLLLLVPILNAQILELPPTVNLPNFVHKQYENYFNHSNSYDSKLTIPETSIFKLSKEINCEGNTCCEELQKTAGRYQSLLQDASGTIRRPGLITGFNQQPADGVISQCQRIKRNEEENSFGGKYCKLDQHISGLTLSHWRCVPDSCTASDLNFVINVSDTRISQSFDYLIRAVASEGDWWFSHTVVQMV